MGCLVRPAALVRRGGAPTGCRRWQGAGAAGYARATQARGARKRRNAVGVGAPTHCALRACA